jgi:hypothetical protein
MTDTRSTPAEAEWWLVDQLRRDAQMQGERPGFAYATADGTARDLTWPRPGLAYLGIPVHAEAAARIMGERRGPLLYAVEGLGSELAVEWAREGIPAEILADVGRPIPAAD